MALHLIDWSIIAGFMLLSLVVGAVVSRRSGKSTSSFFLSNRRLPWWMLGVSMVATTFSTDTPNLVTEIVRTNGVAGNWVWWAFLLTGMVTAFLYARLWRRAGVLTDLEFYELRYSGIAAVVVRAFRAIYLGVFFNAMVMALVTLAAIKISAVILGASPLQTVLVVGVVTVVFTTLGGFLGVVITDLILFFAAMAGAVATAVVVVNLPQVGGLQELITHPAVVDKLALFPSFSNWDMALTIFVIPLAVQWWSVWYPGAEPGGGGYVAQRMLAAKDEDNALGAVVLFQIAHYALRPWPWIIVALASLVVFPDLASIQAAFPYVAPEVVRHDLAYPAMLTFLPTGLIGLVLASLAAAYMSTMSSQLNWGSSYLVNDCYHRFVRPAASQRELVMVGRCATLLLMGIACVMALYLESAMQAFNILLTIGAGTGLMLLLRWYWWRINAYCEIAAMAVSFSAALYFEFGIGDAWGPHYKLLAGLGLTTTAWLLAAFMAPATDKEVLSRFYQLIRPPGSGWAKVRLDLEREGVVPGAVDPRDNLALGILNVFLGCVGTFSALFATGAALYGQNLKSAILAAVAVGAFTLLYRAFAAVNRSGNVGDTA